MILSKQEDKVCVWVYGLLTDVPGDYVKKPMRECTGKEITEEWLYHMGVPVEEIPDIVLSGYLPAHIHLDRV